MSSITRPNGKDDNACARCHAKCTVWKGDLQPNTLLSTFPAAPTIAAGDDGEWDKKTFYCFKAASFIFSSLLCLALNAPYTLLSKGQVKEQHEKINETEESYFQGIFLKSVCSQKLTTFRFSFCCFGVLCI